jgi:DNA-binding transcriptional ArsR family regulator
METVVAACRAVASGPRLRLLHALSVTRELTVGELAERSVLEAGLASIHLRTLAAAGLVVRRRSGARVHYRLAPPQPREVAFVPTRLLHRAFGEPGWAMKGWRHDRLVHVQAAALPGLVEDVAGVFDVVFDAATAFTHMRRLLIVRLLVRAGLSNEEGIRADLSMSRAACYRHLSKLERRGYVRQRGDGSWALTSSHSSRFHGALLSLVVHRLRLSG